jgi:hypothetical protein
MFCWKKFSKIMEAKNIDAFLRIKSFITKIAIYVTQSNQTKHQSDGQINIY